jgi:hypothetical protein
MRKLTDELRLALVVWVLGACLDVLPRDQVRAQLALIALLEELGRART